jgi:hypothetical protein
VYWGRLLCMAEDGEQDERRPRHHVISTGRPFVPENYVVAREAAAGVRHGRRFAVFMAGVGVVLLAQALFLFHHGSLRWVLGALGAIMLLNAWGQLRRRQRILDGVATWDAARSGRDH